MGSPAVQVRTAASTSSPSESHAGRSDSGQARVTSAVAGGPVAVVVVPLSGAVMRGIAHPASRTRPPTIAATRAARHPLTRHHRSAFEPAMVLGSVSSDPSAELGGAGTVGAPWRRRLVRRSDRMDRIARQRALVPVPGARHSAARCHLPGRPQRDRSHHRRSGRRLRRTDPVGHHRCRRVGRIPR